MIPVIRVEDGYTIWKFPFRITDRQELSWPSGGEVLHVGLDAVGQPCLWVLVDPSETFVKHTLAVVGTGNPMSEGLYAHLGSFVSAPFVWHVFEEYE